MSSFAPDVPRGRFNPPPSRYSLHPLVLLVGFILASVALVGTILFGWPELVLLSGVLLLRDRYGFIDHYGRREGTLWFDLVVLCYGVIMTGVDGTVIFGHYSWRALAIQAHWWGMIPTVGLFIAAAWYSLAGYEDYDPLH